MTREEYINSSYDKYLYSWTNITLLIGSVVILLLILLDYFATPSNLTNFLYYRLIASSFLILFYSSNKIKIDRKYQNYHVILAVIVVTSMVSLMIAKFDGHQSVYFAGIILISIFAFGLMPLTLKPSIIVALLIYTIYFVPILTYDTITNKSFFFSANILILFCTFSLLLFRHISVQRLLKEFGLQYDLDQQKEHLEELVQERTKELSVSEKKLKSLFEYATDGIMILDEDGKILEVNQKACEIYGFGKNKLVSTNLENITVNKSLSKERIEHLIEGGSLLFETQHLRKDGKKVSLEIAANAIEIAGKTLIQAFVRNISDKKRLQEQLIQSQKMESIGSLAGGIAHNFNNLLTAILGNAELLEEYSHLDSKLGKRAKHIENSAKKAGDLVSKLLSFARRDSFEIIPLNLNEIINEVLLFEGVLGKKIKLESELGNNLSTVEGDRNQLEQVVMNLIVNARDAMPDGGLINIITTTVEVQENNSDMPAYIKNGHYVLLTVSDTGRGIPENIINRIFEPFFTTKERGKGTGLGLSMVYGIVKDHRGYITVQSDLDRGTNFYVYLPVSGKPVQETPQPEPFDLYGHENILVIDDEENVLDYIKDSLESHGYQSIAIDNPLEAIDLFRDLSDEVDLVITDNIMPQMEGKELIKHLRAIKPDMKIIAISGYSEEPIIKDKILIDAFVKKPFEGSKLLSTIRRVLDREITPDYQDKTKMRS